MYCHNFKPKRCDWNWWHGMDRICHGYLCKRKRFVGLLSSKFASQKAKRHLSIPLFLTIALVMSSQSLWNFSRVKEPRLELCRYAIIRDFYMLKWVRFYTLRPLSFIARHKCIFDRHDINPKTCVGQPCDPMLDCISSLFESRQWKCVGMHSSGYPE